jgi:hypothetical protein
MDPFIEEKGKGTLIRNPILGETIQRGPIEIQTSDRTAAVDSHHNRTLLLA